MNYSTVFSGYTNERGSKDRSVLRCIMKTFAFEKDPKIQHAGFKHKNKEQHCFEIPNKTHNK